MANVGPFTWYVRDNAPTSTVGWSAVTAWATGATIAAGALRRQLATPAVNSERVFVCVVAGTTHATTEPTWVLTKGAKTTDNTVTWQECTGQPGVNGDATNCPTWLQNKNTAVTLGHIICNAAQTFLFICTTAGTTGNGAEPTWNTTAGVTTADNTVTWTSLGAVGSFGAWAAPHARLQNAFTTNWLAAGGSVFVADDHSETQSTTINLVPAGTGPLPCFVWCMDHAASFPLGAATLKTTAIITCSGALVSLNIYGYWCGYGLNFKSAATSGSGLSVLSANAGTIQLDTCSFEFTGSGTAVLFFGGSSGLAECVITNTAVTFSAVGQGIRVGNVRFLWKNTTAPVLGVIPTTLFPAASNVSASVTVDGVDLSAVNTTLVAQLTGPLNFQFIDCKFASGVTVAAAQLAGGGVVDVVRSDSAATIYRSGRYTFRGQHVSELVAVRSGGASDGTTALSWKVTTTANPNFQMPFECFQIGIWNGVTAANVTCAVCGIWAGAALPNNDQIWMDVEYLGSAVAPLATFKSGTKSSKLATGSALAADTSAWDSLATARANTTAYVLGQTIKLASNPGRLFFCTTAGTSAGSEPGGYASAVDGGSVTDNTAIFQAGFRFKLVVTLNSPQPQLAGDLYAIVRAALPSSTFWIDPLITLT